ncbi:FAD-dependent oxidoreductase [Leucobacter sp. CSA1]|uniref:FAD-dependent oxidoreductase n=1 Tax=Leucobacter chromiisoli TaxID=2796471 RepID=A0A934Q4V9_9MICO|nr:FAD-dependent oxidoreductase [Leucobacter chromiisoli]MBK0417475.1 FAD-dependent oxidoreductase [Leucobacter chromiisoli]
MGTLTDARPGRGAAADFSDVVVVGGGQAAAELVKSLRREGFDGSVRLFCNEPYLPYDRPPLSKGVMKSRVEIERLAFLGAAGYEKIDVAVETGRAVVAIDPDRRLVVTDDGREIGYGSCVLATGARAVPAPWSETTRVHSVRTYEDALRLHDAISSGARRFLVVGGGYLGLETASSLTAEGLDVALVEASPTLLTGRASAFTSRWLQEQHEARGLRIHLGSLVAELEETGDEVRVRLADGTEIVADQVVFAVGALANLDLAEAIGAEHGRGVLVNSQCETSVPGVYAIGDVASFRTPSGAEARVESVFNATSQAKTLARVLTGKEIKETGAPTFWSDQVGVSIRLAGWVPPTLETTDVVTTEEDGWFVERYLGGKLVAVESMNRIVDYLRAVPSIVDLRRKL